LYQNHTEQTNVRYTERIFIYEHVYIKKSAKKSSEKSLALQQQFLDFLIPPQTKQLHFLALQRSKVTVKTTVGQDCPTLKFQCSSNSMYFWSWL